jgi:hypothetical protein
MSYFGIPIRNGLPIGLGSVAPLGINTFSPFSPASFFANGEQGWWYDPSNFSTLFQDSAGTTPVTAVEQPVGLQLDLSKGLVLGPELFASSIPSGTGWTGTNASAVGNVVTFSAQFGNRRNAQTTEADKWYRFTFKARRISGNTALNIFHENSQSGDYTAFTVTSAVATYQITVRGRAGGGQINFGVQDRNASGWGDLEVYDLTVASLAGNHRFQTTSANRPVVSARVNLFVGTATLATQSVTTRATTHTLTFTGAGSITLTGTAIGIYTAGTYSVTTTAGTLTATVLGTVTQADLRETNVGVGLPAYQAVVTSTNYNSTGFPVYIKPNGSNQFMQTNSINFTATDKMTVWQGVRKLSDAATAILMELGTNGFQTGNFAFFCSDTGGTYSFVCENSFYRPSGYAAPITNVLSCAYDLSKTSISEEIIPRINGVLAQSNPTGTGTATGNFSNRAVYFYSRVGTSVFFGGNDYGSIARGAASTAAQITNGETYINSLTKAF